MSDIKWMAMANTRYAEWEAEQRRLRGEDDRERRDRDARLSEVNEHPPYGRSIGAST